MSSRPSRLVYSSRYGYSLVAQCPTYKWTDDSEKPASKPSRQKKEKTETSRGDRDSHGDSGSAPIHCLPDELLLAIFGMLDLADLSRSVIPVCSRWHRLGTDRSLWSAATLTFDPLTGCAEDFITTLKTAPLLGAVEYRSYDKKTREDVAQALTQGCQRILSLTLLPWYLTNNMLCKILEHLAEGDHLEHLEIFLTDLAVLVPICRMDNLRSLTLHGEVSFVSDMLSKLGTGCQRLTELDLGGLRFTDIYRLDQLMEGVVRGHAATLDTLRLPPNLTSTGILDAVAECTKLKVLAIWITSDITTASLTKALADIALESLTWRNYDAWLDSAELAQFILYSDKFLLLREFRLVDCIDMDNGLALAIAHRCANLRGLSLHRSELSAEGLHEVISRARGLVRLDVFQNTDFGVDHLERIPEHMPGLLDLDVRRCYSIRTADPSVWNTIAAQLPLLRFRFD